MEGHTTPSSGAEAAEKESGIPKGALTSIVKKLNWPPFLFVIAIGLVLTPISRWSPAIAAVTGILAAAALVVFVVYEVVIQDIRAQRELAAKRRRNYLEGSEATTKFWMPFARGRTSLIIGRFTDEFAAFEETGLVGVGDAIALSEITTYLNSIGLREIDVHYADRTDGDVLDNNLILLGGPDANSVTRDTVARIRSNLRPGNHEIHEITIRDNTSGQRYSPSLGSDGRLKNDYGVLLSVPSPFSNGKRALVVFGCFGYGTWAAIKFVLSDAFLRHPDVFAGNDVECLVEAEIVRGVPHAVRPIILRGIEVSEPARA